MSSLLSSGEITSLTGEFVKHFDTFSQWRNIVINKEPIKTIINNSSTYAGYGNENTDPEYTLTPVYATYPAIILYEYNSNQSDINNATIKIRFGDNKVRIKVKKDARDYIKNGKTENIIVDENIYNTVSSDKVQGYLGLQYYYFDLEATY